MQDAKHGSKLLAAYLSSRKLTITGFARLLGISRIHLCFLVHWRRKPSLDLAARIEDMTAGKVPAKSWIGRPLREPEMRQ